MFEEGIARSWRGQPRLRMTGVKGLVLDAGLNGARSWSWSGRPVPAQGGPVQPRGYIPPRVFAETRTTEVTRLLVESLEPPRFGPASRGRCRAHREIVEEIPSELDEGVLSLGPRRDPADPRLFAMMAANAADEHTTARQATVRRNTGPLVTDTGVTPASTPNLVVKLAPGWWTPCPSRGPVEIFVAPYPDGGRANAVPAGSSRGGLEMVGPLEDFRNEVLGWSRRKEVKKAGQRPVRGGGQGAVSSAKQLARSRRTERLPGPRCSPATRMFIGPCRT